MKKRSICLTIMLLLTFSVTVNSAYWESSVTQIGTISPNPTSDFGRLLFKFDMPDQLKGVIIDYAELRFTATPDTGKSYICLMGAFPVTKSWVSANLSWSDSWTNSGGDYADSIYTSCLIRTSTDKLTRIDITDIVQMWVDGTIANYGLILMPLEDSNRFLKLHNSLNLPPNVKAKVRIFYTREVSD